MSQKYKSVYFPDYPADSSRKRSLTLGFGPRHYRLYETIKGLSSHDLRQIIGYDSFTSLQQDASNQGMPVGTYCLHVLEKKVAAVREGPVQYRLFTDHSEVSLPIDPLQATFRGGQSEPLHSWYPLLEGYSPGFVQELLRKFAPRARHVLDPFSGVGTTPMTVAGMGITAFYCELNPVLQYLTEAKSLALSLNKSTRSQMADRLKSLATDVPRIFNDSRPDQQLDTAYSRVFGSSRFFDPATYIQVLQARSAVDKLSCTEPLVAHFLAIAILASLVPASLLIRAGDVRFKTEKELRNHYVDFVSSVQQKLLSMAVDLEKLETMTLTRKPVLVCEDARHLEKVPNLHIDTVISSPPYLNGTNYFRNTKIELWFLRSLQSNEDLAAFRFKAVTAGINDVTVDKPVEITNPDLAALVSRLEETAYDRRIPRMVASYFTDMDAIVGAMQKHLTPDAILLIDIGDSCYSNIHVPTDGLLGSLICSRGFELESEIVLRRRLSRNGFPLRQVLLVFRKRRPRYGIIKESAAPLEPVWARAWRNFKAQLPHQQGPFAKRNWGHPLHSLCSYQGKMKPSLASHLVRTFVSKGGKLLDPFAGVGTIPFEAALQGIEAWGFEISPAAFHIAAAKVGRPDPAACEELLETLSTFIASNEVTETELAAAEAVHFNSAIPDYFHERTLQEVLLARRYFLEHPPASASESLVLASLLHILHGNRPYALSRRSHSITPFAPTGPLEYRPLLPRLRNKVWRSLAVSYPTEFAPGKMIYEDATAWWPQELEELDAIITSPPFFDSTRFYLANWMRLWFCGWEAADFRTRPLVFVDERQKDSFAVYEPIFRQARERLKPEGVMVMHLGQSHKCDMAEALSQVAAKWFRAVDIFSESVSHCESHGIRDKGTVSAHQYLVLQ